MKKQILKDDGFMNRHEAYSLAQDELEALKKLSLKQLSSMIDEVHDARISVGNNEYLVLITMELIDEGDALKIRVAVDSPNVFKMKRVEEFLIVRKTRKNKE